MQNNISFPKQKPDFQALSDKANDVHQQSRNKIHPIPITRLHLPNSSKLRRRLRINRYKNFSKISAAGPHTLQILKNLKNSSYVKIPQKFEFDPYLCDSSCLTELRIVLQKLKSIKQLCLIIRRFDGDKGLDELNFLSPNIYKLKRLEKIKLEFPSIPDIQLGHILAMYRTLQKCYLLKSFDWTVTKGPEASVKHCEGFVKLMKRLVKLESYRESTSIKKGVSNYGAIDSNSFHILPKFRNIKNLESNYSTGQEWTGMSENGDIGTELFARYVSRYVDVEKFKSKLIKNSFSYQDILVWLKGFEAMPSLTWLEVELLNCEIGDIELIAFAYGLSQNTRLKNIYFKFIQKTPISIEYIKQFIEKVVRIDNLENFNLYFRTQTLSTREIALLENTFSRFLNINYSFGKQSLHLYK